MSTHRTEDEDVQHRIVTQSTDDSFISRTFSFVGLILHTVCKRPGVVGGFYGIVTRTTLALHVAQRAHDPDHFFACRCLPAGRRNVGACLVIVVRSVTNSALILSIEYSERMRVRSVFRAVVGRFFELSLTQCMDPARCAFLSFG